MPKGILPAGVVSASLHHVFGEQRTPLPLFFQHVTRGRYNQNMSEVPDSVQQATAVDLVTELHWWRRAGSYPEVSGEELFTRGVVWRGRGFRQRRWGSCWSNGVVNCSDWVAASQGSIFQRELEATLNWNPGVAFTECFWLSGSAGCKGSTLVDSLVSNYLSNLVSIALSIITKGLIHFMLGQVSSCIYPGFGGKTAPMWHYIKIFLKDMKGKERSPIHWLPKWLQQPERARPKPEARSCIPVFCMGDRGPSTWGIPHRTLVQGTH